MREARSLEQTYQARILGFFVLVGACRPLGPSHSDGMRTTWRFSSEEEASVLDTPPPSTQPVARSVSRDSTGAVTWGLGPAACVLVSLLCTCWLPQLWTR